MKKLLVFVLVLTVALSACGKEETTTASETTVPLIETATTVFETTDVTAETTVIEEPAIDIEKIDTETVTPDMGDGIYVEYEVVTFDNEEIDALVKAKAKEVLDSYKLSAEKEFGAEDVEYDVEMASIYTSESLISAVFSGDYTVMYERSETYGEVLYTINLDPRTGKVLETPDIVDYNKMLEAFKNGRFDASPDFSHYDTAYGIYPYVSVENTDAGVRLGVYVTKRDMYEEVLGYYIAPESASDFLKIQLTSEE